MMKRTRKKKTKDNGEEEREVGRLKGGEDNKKHPPPYTHTHRLKKKCKKWLTFG